ncbi:fibrinogen C domain-containing protein 1 [Aplysia californica]|uniref:Fibrinogen C domain-containing protein 1 n=1 Tax=Aplysia californica TaxID=6500 RepID=A0ABM0JE69_APLCA|nr:fibrinogen C domain-containing protein 1 [Aplysia californica]
MKELQWIWLFVGLLSRPGLTRNPPPVENTSPYCSSVFNVWQPGHDAQMMFREIYSKVDNLTAFTKFEVAELKSYMIQELSNIRNSSFSLEKQMLLKQIDMMDEELVQMKLYTGTSKVKTDLQSVTRRVDRLERSLYSLQTKLPNSRLSKNRPRHDSLPQQQGVNADIASMLKNSVGDLKAEWLLLKRDVESLKKEMHKLKDYRSAVLNDTFSLKVSLDAVLSDSKKLEMKTYEVADMQNRLDAKIERLTSDVEQLRLVLNEHKEQVEQQKNTMNTLQDSSVRLQRELNEVHVRLAHGGQMSLTPSRSGETHSSSLSSENVVLNGPPETRVSGKSSTGERSAFPQADSQFPSDCHDVFNQGFRVSAEYQILPRSMSQMQSVYCQMINGTGYTLLQRRIDGTLSFNRRWLEYQHGFGNPYGEMWIGNELIHQLTTQVSGEENNYQLHVDGYTGTAGDSLLYHNKMAFSTEDADNDLHERHCAAENKGGWWYRSCFSSQLNGIYHTAWYRQNSYADGIAWYTLKDDEFYSLKKVEMKIKPASP